MQSSSFHRCVLVAVSDPLLCAWTAHALRCAAMRAAIITSRADLYDALADQPRALVIDDRFDGAAVERTLAALRTAGADVPAFVLAPWFRPSLVARVRALAPVTLVDDPFDGAALCLAIRAGGARPRVEAPLRRVAMA